jgi:hypothetical protein
MIHEELVGILPALEDPRIVDVNITVTNVRVSGDLGSAHVLIAVDTKDEGKRKKMLKGLEKAEAFIRRQWPTRPMPRRHRPCASPSMTPIRVYIRAVLRSPPRGRRSRMNGLDEVAVGAGGAAVSSPGTPPREATRPARCWRRCAGCTLSSRARRYDRDPAPRWLAFLPAPRRSPTGQLGGCLTPPSCMTAATRIAEDRFRRARVTGPLSSSTITER